MLRPSMLAALCLMLVLCKESNAQRFFRRGVQSQVPAQRSVQRAPQTQQRYAAAYRYAQQPAPFASQAVPANGPQQSPAIIPGGDQHQPWYRCNDCGNPDCQGEGACQVGVNPPTTKSLNDPKCNSTKCVEVQNPPQGKLPEVPGTVRPFYMFCFPFEAQVNVHHLVNNGSESLTFGRQTYNVDCCEFTVCVVTCCCTDFTKQCVNRPYRAKLDVCVRQNGVIDIYVVDVPGMPKRWVYYMGMSREAVEAEFGAEFGRAFDAAMQHSQAPAR